MISRAASAGAFQAATVVLLAVAACSGAPAIRVGHLVAVTSGNHQRPPVEPHLAIDAANPRRLVAGAMTSAMAADPQQMLAKQTCSLFVSLDGGEAWRQHEFPIAGCLDPWVSVMRGGRALFTAFSANTGDLAAFRSDTAWSSWEALPLGLGTGHDHPTTAVDIGSPAGGEVVYLLSNRSGMPVYRSDNGGSAFADPVYLRSQDFGGSAEMAVVRSNGTLVVSYVERVGPDGKDLPHHRAWLVTSADQGHRFSEPALVNTSCGPPYRLSALAVDTSGGPFHDRLYFACNLPGESGVVLSHSGRQPGQWSAAVPVHSAGIDPTIRRKVMALGVNKRGVVGVAWTDARHGTPPADCYDIYFAASLDGGDRFLPEQRITEVTSCPGAAANGPIGRIFAPSGGDYIGMVTDVEGRFRLLWADARDGPFQLLTTWVQVSGSIQQQR